MASIRLSDITFDDLDEILFFGDDMTDGGNDSHIRLGGLDYVWVHDYRDFPQLAGILLK